MTSTTDFGRAERDMGLENTFGRAGRDMKGNTLITRGMDKGSLSSLTESFMRETGKIVLGQAKVK